MHVAAANPLAVNVDEVDPAAVAREKEIFSDQARQSGKPENIIEKMVEGRLRKFYEEVVLVKQAFVINPDLTVEQALKAAEKISVRRQRSPGLPASRSERVSSARPPTSPRKSQPQSSTDPKSRAGRRAPVLPRASRDNAAPFV